jgi:hypothetical protein
MHGVGFADARAELSVALPLAVRQSRRDETPARRTPRWAPAAVLAGYVLLAYAMTWQLWADPAIRVPTTGHGVSADIFLSAWFMRYAAIALTHGRLPALVTTALNAPHGISVMWNTSVLLPAVVLAPVTLLAGPLVSLTVLMTLGFAGSAATMFLVLRRWGARLVPAAVGGALFGFSPALRLGAEDHYHLQFAVLIPLIIDAALRLLTGRGRPVRTGIWLGLLMSAQIFIAEEMLVDTALAALILAVVLAASRPRQIRARLATAAAGLGLAAAVFLALCGYALWTQVRGPLAENGSPWNLANYGNQPADFVTAPPAMVLHTGTINTFARFLAGTGSRLVEYFAYLGWPLLVAVLAATIICWRDLRVRLAGVLFVVLELFSMGGHDARFWGGRLPPYLLPWHWLERLPVLSQVLPNRLSILADGAAAAVLAFALQRAWVAARTSARWQRPVIAALATLVLLPVVPLSVDADSVHPPPPGWTAVLASMHLRRGATVLELPVVDPRTMVWQALSGNEISLAGGYCITRGATGRAASCDTAKTLTADQQTTLLRLHWFARGVPGRPPPGPATFLGALNAWHPAALITTDGLRAPLNRYLISVLGPPTEQHGQVLGWRLGWLTS